MNSAVNAALTATSAADALAALGPEFPQTVQHWMAQRGQEVPVWDVLNAIQAAAAADGSNTAAFAVATCIAASVARLCTQAQAPQPDSSSLLPGTLCDFMRVSEQALMAVPESGRFQLLLDTTSHVCALGSAVALLARKWPQQLADTCASVELMLRYAAGPPPACSSFIVLHADFAELCLLTAQYSLALPILACPITAVDPAVEFECLPMLRYFYSGAIVCMRARNFETAAFLLEQAIVLPTVLPSIFAIEAAKKLILLQLACGGPCICSASALPKQTSRPVLRAIKLHCRAYLEFASVYDTAVRRLADNNSSVHDNLLQCQLKFTADGNAGLANLALQALPARKLERLQRAAVSVSLEKLCSTCGFTSRQDVTSALSHAGISLLEGSHVITFADLPAATCNNKSLVAKVKRQSCAVAELCRQLQPSMHLLDLASL